MITTQGQQLWFHAPVHTLRLIDQRQKQTPTSFLSEGNEGGIKSVPD